jgi:hypothetical protein
MYTMQKNGNTIHQRNKVLESMCRFSFIATLLIANEQYILVGMST